MMTQKQPGNRPHPEQRIKVSKDGPYWVSGRVPLTQQTIVLGAEGCPLLWRTTKEYPQRDNYSLCRCGQSRNKPYCDGSHRDVPFDGTETADRRPYGECAEPTAGPTLDLTDVQALCVSASFCDRAGGTWDLVARSDDPEARRIALEEVANCPSGRLVAWDKSGHVLEPEFEPSIAAISDPDGGVRGTLWVRGGIPIVAADGEVYEVRNRVTLCGCGKSCIKPYCDGTHRPS